MAFYSQTCNSSTLFSWSMCTVPKETGLKSIHHELSHTETLKLWMYRPVGAHFMEATANAKVPEKLGILKDVTFFKETNILATLILFVPYNVPCVMGFSSVIPYTACVLRHFIFDYSILKTSGFFGCHCHYVFSIFKSHVLHYFYILVVILVFFLP